MEDIVQDEVLEQLNEKNGRPYTVSEYIRELLINLGFCKENDDIPDLNDKGFNAESKEKYKKICGSTDFKIKWAANFHEMGMLSSGDFEKLEKSGLTRFLVEVTGEEYISTSDFVKEKGSENLEEHELNKDIIQNENIENINKISENKNESSKSIEQIVDRNGNIENEIGENSANDKLNTGFMEERIINNDIDKPFELANEIKLDNEIESIDKNDKGILEKTHKNGERYTVSGYQKSCLINLCLCGKDGNIPSFRDEKFINNCKTSYQRMHNDINSTRFREGAKKTFGDMLGLSDNDFAKVGEDGFYDFLIQVVDEEDISYELYKRMSKFLKTSKQIQINNIENYGNKIIQSGINEPIATDIKKYEEDKKEKSKNLTKHNDYKADDIVSDENSGIEGTYGETEYMSKYNLGNEGKNNGDCGKYGDPGRSCLIF